MQHVDFTVRPQSIGGAVRLLQELLGITVTGIYDEATWGAVRTHGAKPAPRVKASKKAGA